MLFNFSNSQINKLSYTMDSLIIDATEDSPSVMFDTTTNHFILSGESRPENAGIFFTPLINWLIKFDEFAYQRKREMQDDSTLFFEFKLDYFNSTSAKYIMDLLLLIKKFAARGYKINIEWHYDKRGEDMLDAGKEFSEMVDLKFDFIEF